METPHVTGSPPASEIYSGDTLERRRNHQESTAQIEDRINSLQRSRTVTTNEQHFEEQEKPNKHDVTIVYEAIASSRSRLEPTLRFREIVRALETLYPYYQGMKAADIMIHRVVYKPNLHSAFYFVRLCGYKRWGINPGYYETKYNYSKTLRLLSMSGKVDEAALRKDFPLVNASLLIAPEADKDDVEKARLSVENLAMSRPISRKYRRIAPKADYQIPFPDEGSETMVGSQPSFNSRCDANLASSATHHTSAPEAHHSVLHADAEGPVIPAANHVAPRASQYAPIPDHEAALDESEQDPTEMVILPSGHAMKRYLVAPPTESYLCPYPTEDQHLFPSVEQPEQLSSSFELHTRLSHTINSEDMADPSSRPVSPPNETTYLTEEEVQETRKVPVFDELEVADESTIFNEFTTGDDDLAVVDEPPTADGPALADERAVADESMDTDKSMDTDETIDTEKSIITDEATVADKSTVTEEPTLTDGPTVADEITIADEPTDAELMRMANEQLWRETVAAAERNRTAGTADDALEDRDSAWETTTEDGADEASEEVESAWETTTEYKTQE